MYQSDAGIYFQMGIKPLQRFIQIAAEVKAGLLAAYSFSPARVAQPPLIDSIIK